MSVELLVNEVPITPKRYRDLCSCLQHLIDHELVTVQRTTSERIVASIGPKGAGVFIAFCPNCGQPTTEGEASS